MLSWDRLLRLLLEVLLTVLQYLRFALRRSLSRSWPTATGKVQPCQVEKGMGVWAPYRYRSVFGYAFPANGSRYAGFFALATEDEATAEKLQKAVPGTTVTVRYSPRNPDVALLEDERIFGLGVIQNPHWLP